MALPIRYTRGSLGIVLNLEPQASHEFQDFQPPPRAKQVTFFLRTSRVGDFNIFRVSPNVGPFLLHSIRAESSIVAGQPPEEETIVVLNLAVFGALRCFFVNRGLANAGASLEVAFTE